MSSRTQPWNSKLYQSGHSYIWQYGRDLLALLDAKPGERILDLGCGTGQLTAEVAHCGAEAVGVDMSPEMIASARHNYPKLRFDVEDAAALPYMAEFDAVLSNAALHWVRDQNGAIASVVRALKPGGRFVFEMGGRGNLRQMLEAGCRAMKHFGVSTPETCFPWYFPSIGQYAPLLEAHGLVVHFAVAFPRPTVLEDGEHGLANWIRMFAGLALSAVPVEQQPELIRQWEDLARASLFRDGAWVLDHVRLRMIAVKA